MSSKKYVEETLTMPSDMPLFNYNINFEGLRKLVEALNMQANSNTEQITTLKQQLGSKLPKQKLNDQQQILNNSIKLGQNCEKIVEKLLTAEQRINRKKQTNMSNMQLFGYKMQKLCNVVEQLVKTSKEHHDKMYFDDNKNQKNIDDSFKRIDSRVTSSLDSINKNISMYFTEANKKITGLETDVSSHKRQTTANFETVNTNLCQKISDVQLKAALNGMMEQAKSSILGELNNDNIKRIATLNQFTTKLKQHIKQTDLQIKSARLTIQELAQKVGKSLSLNSFEGEKLKIFERLGQFKNRVEDLSKKNQDFLDFRRGYYETNEQIKYNISEMGDQLKKLSEKGSQFKKIQDIGAILEHLDPHLICQIKSQVKLHEKQIGKLEKQVITLENEMEAGKTSTSRVLELNSGQNAELIIKVIKQHMANIDFDGRLKRTQKQLHDIHQKNSGVNELQKKFYLFSKDIDIGAIMREIKKKSDDENTRKDFKVLDGKIGNLFDYYKQLRRDIEELFRKLAKIGKQTGDNASLTTKRLYSPYCLSCSNNETPRERPQSTKNWRVKMDMNNIDTSAMDHIKNTINLKATK